jgi:hypothetical protein
MAALALALVAGAGWGGWMSYNRLQPPKKTIALISDFDGSQATRRVDFGRRITEETKTRVQRLKLDATIDVKRSYQTYPQAEAARAAGEARKATLVIWGWYDDVGVNPHFELLRAIAPYEAGLRRSADLKTFDL